MSAEPEKNGNGEKTILDEELRPIIESLLFSTSEPLSIKRLNKIVPDAGSKDLRRAVIDLQLAYDQDGRGFQIVEVAGGYQMASRKKYASYILLLNRQKKRSPLSTPALETIAIIAYKQPIVRAEIEAIRGVDSSGIIRNLMELGLIKVVGKKDVVGRPPLYGTTDEFLKVFGLKRLTDLPSIKELRKKFEETLEES